MLTELMTLSEKIKILRDKNGYTQSELAKKVGLTRSAVNAWEMSNAIPSTEIIIKLAKIFGVTTDYLLGVDNEEKISVKDLNPKEIDSIQNVINCIRERK